MPKSAYSGQLADRTGYEGNRTKDQQGRGFHRQTSKRANSQYILLTLSASDVPPGRSSPVRGYIELTSG